ncbi:MAG TPA: alpha/beta fold hydrolase [Chroococcales cyanobacterium]
MFRWKMLVALSASSLAVSALLILPIRAALAESAGAAEVVPPVPVSDARRFPLVREDPPVSQAQLAERIHKAEASLRSHPKSRPDRRRLAVLYTLSTAEGDAGRAKNLFEQLVKEHEDTDSLMDLASCYYRTNFDETFKLCSKAAQYNNGKEYPRSIVELALGGSRYRKNDLKSAEQYYRQSLDDLTGEDLFIIAKMDLAGLAGIYWRQNDFKGSAAYYQELYRLARDAYGADDIECGWALFQASQALSKGGDKALSEKCWNRAIWIFRKSNADRIIDEYRAAHANVIPPAVEERVHQTVFAGTFSPPAPDPFDAAHSPYSSRVSFDLEGFASPFKRQFKQTEAPGWVWLDPSVPTRAVLICVHGLGLHHRAYESFARRIEREGILTIAFDVRGFGTFMEANGQERLDMQGCVEDLRAVLKLLKHDYRDYPVFLLGESMGGALALRVVAENPEQVDGLICSVPSGSRYRSLSTKLRVGADFLKSKSRPVPVGIDVVKQATKNEDLRDSWMNDPASRLSLSPQELINFQKFMDENTFYARKITSKPVILFQGNDDKLVKEKGTLDLFQALATPEKSIVILGGTEHLIFEAGQFKDDLTLGVLGWMSAHFKSAAPDQGSLP